ncbi:unnamed protein product, partial [marine sediment metagenome]
HIFHTAERAKGSIEVSGRGEDRVYTLTEKGNDYIEDLKTGLDYMPQPQKGASLGKCDDRDVWEEMFEFKWKPGVRLPSKDYSKTSTLFRTPNLKEIATECSQNTHLSPAEAATFIVAYGLKDAVEEKAKLLKFRDKDNIKGYDRLTMLHTCSWLDTEYTHLLVHAKNIQNKYGIIQAELNYWRRICNIPARPGARKLKGHYKQAVNLF